MAFHSSWQLLLLALAVIPSSGATRLLHQNGTSGGTQPMSNQSDPSPNPKPSEGSMQELYRWVPGLRESTELKEKATKAFWCLADGFYLNNHNKERHVFSQLGEDGVIEFISDCIGTTDKFYVEFGTQDGSECTTRYLREQKGWTGLLMDGDFENPGINLHKEFMTMENIVDLFRKYDVPRPSFDHLTVDIDLNTPYLLREILAAGYRPRQMVVEYNRNFHPKQSYTVVYSPTEQWGKSYSCYFGGSALAIERIAKAFGYSLVAFDKGGVNLFFVDNIVLGMPFPHSYADLTFTDVEVFRPLHHECQHSVWMYVQDTERLAHSDWLTYLHPVMLSYSREGNFRKFKEADSVWSLRAYPCSEPVVDDTAAPTAATASVKHNRLDDHERRRYLCQLEWKHKHQKPELLG